LGERYRHFFIDEFQDTSEMQWQNLIPLIDNALSGQDDFGDKGTLMIVGDPNLFTAGAVEKRTVY
jgi:ATP-dependent exoDNAse (exonuclease V) beta subunit